MNSTPSDAHRVTLDYYERNAQAYDERTRGMDLSPLYDEFLPLLPTGGHILDAGCGTGRDSAAFRGRGFRVTAFDPSTAMAEIASARLGVPVLRLSFQELDFHQAFDGIWASASLLHVPKQEMPGVLQTCHDALVPGGVLYACFKKGTGEAFREGRFFNDYTESELLETLARSAAWEVLKLWETDDIRQGRAEVQWVNVLARAR
jgi:SAM-dependent methyltransferase